MHIISVPEAAVRTRTPPDWSMGGGTLSNVVAPVFTFWSI